MTPEKRADGFLHRKIDVGAVEMHALAETGERGAIDGVAIVGEEFAGALPLPAAGGGAMHEHERVFLGGLGGPDVDRRQEENDHESECAKQMSFHGLDN